LKKAALAEKAKFSPCRVENLENALPRKAKSGSAAGENRDKDNAASILE
jgi:hypothetical protein